MKLIFTKLITLVPLEECNHQPLGMYSGGISTLALMAK